MAPDQTTYSKSRGNVAKIKVEIDLLKPRLDQIWLRFKRLDGTDDGRWLDIEYEKISNYCLYCRMQGHMESQCRNKIWDDRIKLQRKEKTRKEAQNKKEDGFQNVTRKRASKMKSAPSNNNVKVSQNGAK